MRTALLFSIILLSCQNLYQTRVNIKESNSFKGKDICIHGKVSLGRISIKSNSALISVLKFDSLGNLRTVKNFDSDSIGKYSICLSDTGIYSFEAGRSGWSSLSTKRLHLSSPKDLEIDFHLKRWPRYIRKNFP